MRLLVYIWQGADRCTTLCATAAVTGDAVVRSTSTGVARSTYMVFVITCKVSVIYKDLVVQSVFQVPPPVWPHLPVRCL